MAYTTIDDSSAYFNTLTWSGDNASSRSFTGLGFSPDWTWIKSRSDGAGHNLYDSVRGANKRLDSGGTGAETTNHAFGRISSFDSDGFTLEEGTYTNYESGDTNMTGRTYVGWSWRASDSNAVSNTDGSITSTISANTTAGFSIVTYTGTGSNATVGHGLGATPKFIIAKNRDASEGWIIDSSIITGNANGTLHFNTDAEYTGGSNQFGTHSSTNISIKTAGNINTGSQKYVAYCFAPIQGYSKIVSYEGNGNADGPFVYTGFKPSFILMKNIDAAENWLIYDNKRDPHNVTDEALLPNSGSASGGSANAMDLLSNGFKLRQSAGSLNGSNKTFVYMAFAEHPFVSSEGVPVTAR